MAAATATLDGFGLPVTTNMAECLAGINAYYQAVLSYKPFSGWAVADAALAADGVAPMAKVLAADFAFCRGDGGRAEALLKELADDTTREAWTERERMYVEAWTRWCLKGDPTGCYEVLYDVVSKFPQDLFAVKRGHIMGLILGSGDKIMEIVRLAAEASSSSAPARYLHGMWAFGLEQQGRYAEAEAKAKEGLALEGDLHNDAWLDHGLAHALYFQGQDRLDEAIDFLESKCESWSAESLHPFLYTHNWWHLALLYTENRDFEDAFKVYDERLWSDAHADMKADPQVQLNALGLLWRMETRGKSELARLRWTSVLEACAGLTLPAEDGARGSQQHADLLLDVLLVRGLCALAAGKGARRLDAWLAAVASHAEELAKGPGGANGRAEAYAEVCQNVAVLYRADQPESGAPARHAAARKRLKELRDRWSAIGGSEEQRGILLEAVEAGPIVCGAPEQNYDSLFMG